MNVYEAYRNSFPGDMYEVRSSSQPTVNQNIAF